MSYNINLCSGATLIIRTAIAQESKDELTLYKLRNDKLDRSDGAIFNAMASQTRERQILMARWVLPVTAPPLVDGAVVIDGDKIVDVLPQDQLRQRYSQTDIDGAHDYGRCTIVPGFINMHSHLDYSALHGLAGERGEEGSDEADGADGAHTKMFDWIRALVARSSQWSAPQWYQSALSGAQQSALNGISCVADSSFTGFSLKALAVTGLRGVVALELFGIKEDETDAVWQQWLGRYEKLISDACPQVTACLARHQLQVTVSPHAPYTVCPSLWRKAHDWARQRSLPIFSHLCESVQECAWIKEGNRTIDEYLTFVRRLKNPALATTDDGIAVDVNQIKWNKEGLSPVAHLARHQLLCPDLIAAHCIHLSEDDLDLLADTHVKVVHCPRSNVALGNGRARLEKLMQHQIDFSFGTDSLASCNDLDLLNECRFAAQMHELNSKDERLTAPELLRRLTIEAAKMLQMEDRIGSLEPGKQADIAVFASDEIETAAYIPAQPLIFSRHRLIDLYVAGMRIVANGTLTSEAPVSA